MSCAQLPLTLAQVKDSDHHGSSREKIKAGLQILAGPQIPLLVSSGTFVVLWLLISYLTGFSLLLFFWGGGLGCIVCDK